MSDEQIKEEGAEQASTVADSGSEEAAKTDENGNGEGEQKAGEEAASG